MNPTRGPSPYLIEVSACCAAIWPSSVWTFGVAIYVFSFARGRSAKCARERRTGRRGFAGRSRCARRGARTCTALRPATTRTPNMRQTAATYTGNVDTSRRRARIGGRLPLALLLLRLLRALLRRRQRAGYLRRDGGE